ncbi:MAG: hypothetical protein LBJ20_03685 [Candidatus Methanoplasma sp.]|jgi:bifunctional DNA-binding transcriptional regulator/antitoxin component of YhaV-PrlF toxin-antitoxin module|nr:hypothetical protein [Candidatus Methanoplasma sp.]
MPRIIASRQILTNNRITFPPEIVSQMNLQKKDTVHFVEDDDGQISIRKAEA